MMAANPETASLLRSIPFSSMTRRTALERSRSLLRGKNSDNIMKARSGISLKQQVACVASGSMQFGSKELQGDEWRGRKETSPPLPPPFFFWLSPHFPRRQNTENPVPLLFLGLSLLPNPTETLATQAKQQAVSEPGFCCLPPRKK